jgi:pimeloyl-ACP methyl ester carboxylesterase
MVTYGVNGRTRPVTRVAWARYLSGTRGHFCYSGGMSKVTSKDGTTIAYSKWGSGPAIVLVDGAFCFRQNGPTPKLAPELAKHFTVYAYDRRGRGESADTPPYAVEREIEDLEAVVAEAGETPYVFGQSSGGALILRALAHGLTVKKVFLYEVPCVAVDASSAQPPKAALLDVAALIADGRRSDAVTYFMTKVFGAPGIAITLMRLIARSSWKRNESVAQTLPYDLELMGDWGVPPAVTEVTVPTMVMSGEKAPRKLRVAADALAAAIPDAQRAVLPGQSHNVKATALAPAIEAFCKE